MRNQYAYVSRSESFDIENPYVSVETVSEEVKIVESSDANCHVEILTKSESFKHVADLVEITARGQKISVRVGKKNGGLRDLFGSRSHELSIVIKLPSASSLKVKTVSADVEVDQSLLSIEASSVSGDISVLRNPKQTCILKTVSGDISAHTFSACQYSLKSISGNIRVHVAPGLEIDVDGKSLSGNLESEISLGSSNDSSVDGSEPVGITASTISGNFVLARN